MKLLSINVGLPREVDWRSETVRTSIFKAPNSYAGLSASAIGIPFGSDPWHVENKELNSWNGGRGVYFRDPNGHLLELMTRVPSEG